MTAMNTSGKRQIKASEIKEGMTIQLQMEVDFVRKHRDWPTFFRDDGRSVGLDGDIEVEVLSESQPEEPTAFGARVVAGGYEFLLSHGGRRSWKARLDGNRYSWAEVCGLGPVTIIDADPSWTVPEQATETPEVPEHIEEWDTWEDVPEGVAVTNPGLRYRYRKAGGKTEVLLAPVGDAEWLRAYVSMESQPGPWTRVTDA